MLLAIDVGNTHTKFGLWDGSRWVAVWRRETSVQARPSQIGFQLRDELEGLRLGESVTRAICASVVPDLDKALSVVCEQEFGITLWFLRDANQIGFPVEYSPAGALGVDRLANVVGATSEFSPPIVVVDFGTATTFEVIDGGGVFVGGSILPGMELAARALWTRSPRLPEIAFDAPARAIGRNTKEALQSGIVLGYALMVEGLLTQMSQELGSRPAVIATGGLGEGFVALCPSIQTYDPMLTLNGLRLAYARTV